MNFMQEKVSWFQGLYSALNYENKPQAGCAYGSLGTCCFRDEWEEDVALALSTIIVEHFINSPHGPGKTALTCGFVESALSGELEPRARFLKVRSVDRPHQNPLGRELGFGIIWSEVDVRHSTFNRLTPQVILTCT